MALAISIPEVPSGADHDAIFFPLNAFNTSEAGDPRIAPLALMLTNDAGNRVGGLWGSFAYDWLVIEMVFVPEEYRGENWGRALMAQAEKMARSQARVGMWLDTFDFQARGFYEKLGFQLFGEITDHPVGRRRLFLAKRF